MFAYDAGYVSRPKGPGLGIELNEEYIRKQAQIGHSWKNPVWRYADGVVAEW